ncbi:hypothetical protein C5Y93_29570 [Blastopirellula marina]|uniref:Uncharacterized protein n=1 Tax=Blastopirellula marina TaxID=124 RepID=A0A2S8GDE4_9BACT|nr:hypothetical protein C5Y93_29570 [Blastopirellula marina]
MEDLLPQTLLIFGKRGIVRNLIVFVDWFCFQLSLLNLSAVDRPDDIPKKTLAPRRDHRPVDTVFLGRLFKRLNISLFV